MSLTLKATALLAAASCGLAVLGIGYFLAKRKKEKLQGSQSCPVLSKKQDIPDERRSRSTARPILRNVNAAELPPSPLKSQCGGDQKAGREGTGDGFPSPNDPVAREKFFRDQVKLGEQAMLRGDTQKMIGHISQAVAVCGQPEALLSFLKPLLADHYNLLVEKMPHAREQFLSGATEMD